MTTTFQTPLQTGDYTKLRGTNGNNMYAAQQFITLCKNTVVFQAQANGSISSTSFAQITFHNVTVGVYTAIEAGETFFLSHTTNIRDAYYRGRVRTSATSTILTINETSVNVTDGDYIFVVYDFDIWDKLSRMVGSTQYIDFDFHYEKLPPVVVGLQTAYVNWDPTDGVYRIPFDVSNSYSTDQYSSNVLTYQFVFVGGTYSVHSGALNTAIVTVDFNANTEQWGYLLIEDSQGTQWIRRFYIRAHGSTDTPALDFNGAKITGSIDNGWNATVDAWGGVDSVLAQTFCVIWSQEYYNGTLGSIYNNIDMVGRFHRETNTGRGDALYSYIASVKFDIEGICTQMRRLEMQDLTTIDKSVATVWDEISFNTPQRSIVHYLARHSTVLNLCDLIFPDGFDLTYLFQYIPATGGNIMDAVQSIAKQFAANVEFAPDGSIQVAIDTRFKEEADRSGVPVIGNFDNRDFTAIDNLDMDSVNKTGRLDGYGASYNAGNLIATRSRAPGSAQGYAAGQNTLDTQILKATTDQNAANAEDNFRAGQQIAIDNLTFTQGWKSTHGGYHILIPSRGQRVTHTYTDETNVRGLSFDTSDYWQVVSVNFTHNNSDGAREVTTHEELEPPIGDPGDTVPQIAGGTQANPILLQPLDPFPNLPDDPGNYTGSDPTPPPYPPIVPPKIGETVIYSDGTLADTSRSVVSRRKPVWTGANGNITLGSFLIKDVTFDRTSLTPPIGAYVLVSDGTNSKAYYTSDAFATPVVWTEGATFTGVFNQIRSAGTAGSVMMYSSDVAGVPTTIDLKASNGGFVNVLYSSLGPFVNSPDQSGTWVSGSGWEQTRTDSSNAPATNFEAILIGLTFGAPKTITKLVATFNRSVGATVGSLTVVELAGDLSGVNVFFADSGSPGPEGTDVTYQWTGSATIDRIRFNQNCGAIRNPPGGDPGGTCTLTKIEYWEGGGNSKVAYSTNNGGTVSVIDLGSSSGPNGAFDLEMIGGASLAAANAQVKIATSIGGSYSNAAGGTLSAGQPVTLVISVRRFPHGSTQYSASNPDYLLASDTATAGAAVWKVDGATGTKTDITPTAGAVGVGPNLATIWQTSSLCYILIVVSVGGVYKLYRSLDGGSTWSLSKTCVNPIYLRYKRNSPAVLYLLDGSNFYISLDHGATWLQDTLPSSRVTVAMDMYN